jgi:WD40 repeat protein
VLNGHVAEVHSVTFAPNGKVLASADHQGQVLCWDTGTLHILKEWKLPVSVNRLAFSPDGRHLAIATTGRVYVLRLKAPSTNLRQP